MPGLGYTRKQGGVWGMFQGLTPRKVTSGPPNQRSPGENPQAPMGKIIPCGKGLRHPDHGRLLQKLGLFDTASQGNRLDISSSGCVVHHEG